MDLDEIKENIYLLLDMRFLKCPITEWIRIVAIKNKTMDEFLQAFALVSMIVLIIFTTILKFKKMRNIKRLLKRIHTELELWAIALSKIKWC